jgi:hypothetical protein
VEHVSDKSNMGSSEANVSSQIKLVVRNFELGFYSYTVGDVNVFPTLK